MKHSLLLGSLVSAGLLSSASAATLFGLTADNHLVSFDSSAPSTHLSSSAITGLVGADGVTPNPYGAIMNFAARPGATAGSYQLYGIDNNANFYRISNGGAATLVASGFSPAGFNAGFAYDPFNDNFVYADDAGGLYSIALNGTVTPRGNMTYTGGGSPSIFGLGIDPAFGTVYAVDAATDSLYTTFDPLFPTSTELTLVGPLGIDVTAFGGLVVDWDGNLFAAFSQDGLTSSFYSIDPFTGAATAIAGTGISGLAGVAVPEPSAALLGGLGLLALFRRRRA